MTNSGGLLTDKTLGISVILVITLIETILNMRTKTRFGNLNENVFSVYNLGRSNTFRQRKNLQRLCSSPYFWGGFLWVYVQDFLWNQVQNLITAISKIKRQKQLDVLVLTPLHIDDSMKQKYLFRLYRRCMPAESASVFLCVCLCVFLCVYLCLFLCVFLCVCV